MPNELNLNNQKIDVLVVKIEDKEYKIPLATSLPYKEVKTLIGLQKNNDSAEAIDIFINFFKKYIDEDVIENLPMSALNELARAWSGANGEDLGES